MNLEPQAPAVVLIEIDEITLELYQRELSKSFEVYGFTEAEGVLTAVAKPEVRAVVIEPEMQAGEGWNLLEMIDETVASRPIPILVCSTRERNKSLEGLEIARYLIKPVLPRNLRKEVLAALQQQAGAEIAHV